MILRAIAEHLNLQLPAVIQFNNLIDLINANSPGPKVTHRAQLHRLNRAGVNFKHLGVKPDLMDCHTLRQELDTFARFAIPAFLSIDYEDISLAHMVSHVRTRNRLRRAETELGQGALEDSMLDSAIAFELYRAHLRAQERRRRPEGSLLEQGNRRPAVEVPERIVRAFERVEERLGSLWSTIEVLTDGLDPGGFARFERLTPRVRISKGGAPWSSWRAGAPEKLTEAEAEFCFRFALDSVLELQKRAVSPLHRDLFQLPERPLVVKAASRVLAYLGEDAEVIRDVQIGDVLQGHLERHDKENYAAIDQDGDVAYVERAALEPLVVNEPKPREQATE